MICPACYVPNTPGVDLCRRCGSDLTADDRPTPHDRVERSLMADAVSVLDPRPAVTVTADLPLREVMRRMIAAEVGAVLVVDAAGLLVGILTERDFLTRVAGSPGFADGPVRDVMTRDPETVAATDPLMFALGKMATGNYRHIPIVTAGRPVGVLSVRDVLRHIVSQAGA